MSSLNDQKRNQDTAMPSSVVAPHLCPQCGKPIDYTDRWVTFQLIYIVKGTKRGFGADHGSSGGHWCYPCYWRIFHE